MPLLISGIIQDRDYFRMRDAQPNPGRLALARLYEAGRLQMVITQSIDSV
jgi:NAD-dependent SIR2 family protein deacetylase